MNREIGEMSYGELAARAMEYSSWDTSHSLEKTASVVQMLAEFIAELDRRQEAPKGEADICGDISNNLGETASAVRALAAIVAEFVAELDRGQEVPKGEADELAAIAARIICGDISNNLGETASAVRALAAIIAGLSLLLETSTNKGEADKQPMPAEPRRYP